MSVVDEILTSLRLMHEKAKAETWKDERGKNNFLDGIKASIKLIDQDFGEEEEESDGTDTV